MLPEVVTSEGAKFSDRQPRQSDLSSGFRREMRAASPVRRRNDHFLCLESRRPSLRFRPTQLPLFLAPPTRYLSVVIYLERADEWWPLDTERTDRFFHHVCMYIYIYTRTPQVRVYRVHATLGFNVIHRLRLSFFRLCALSVNIFLEANHRHFE